MLLATVLSLTFLPIVVPTASAGGPLTLPAGAHLRFDPDAPPVLVGVSGGYPVYRFEGPAGAPGVELRSRAAVVVTVADGFVPPEGAEWLGGPSWLVPAADPIATAALLAATPGFDHVFPDVLLPQGPSGAEDAGLSFDDPSYGGQWYLEALEMERLFALSTGGAETRVAVLDSGIDIDHADLAAAVLEPYDAWADDGDPRPEPGEYCSDSTTAICDEHGTAVSGIIAARANNAAGIVGMCSSCTLIPIKLLGESGGTPLSADVRAFEHAIAMDVAVINNSWGFTESIPVPETLAAVIHRAATEPRGGLGALVVFAAGNDDRVIDRGELQELDDVLCVSASDSYGYPTNYTNTGPAVDVAAPSATVTIAPGNEVTTTFGGTSAAAPVASGLAAWAAAQDPTLSAQELADLLVLTAVPSPYMPVDESGRNDTYGWGGISAVGVMDALYPADDPLPIEEEQPAACGCVSTRSPSPWWALGLLLLVRRRS
ncbi:MAG: S8 family serine peptidase [Pseudomonadota bacterium]|nr:S8 family serine peptidase [Pseudomonadota bacterium]